MGCKVLRAPGDRRLRGAALPGEAGTLDPRGAAIPEGSGRRDTRGGGYAAADATP